MSKLLAKTWNSNEAGTLWEAYWYYDKKLGYYVDSHGPGFDNPRQFFDSEKDFWKSFKIDKKSFNGDIVFSSNKKGEL